MTTKSETNSLDDERRFLGIQLLRQVREGPPFDRLMMTAAVLGSATLFAVAATIRLIAPFQ
jgi:hypothetical protein